MPAYLVQLSPQSVTQPKNGVNAAVVFAADAANARAVAKGGVADDVNASWDDATVTEVAQPANLDGFTLTITVSDPATAEKIVDITVTGVSSATIDSIAALAVTALNATTPISNAAYNSTTQVLTVAGTADAMGDHRITVEFKPPVSATQPQPVAQPALVGTITHLGAEGSALSVVLAADAVVRPACTALVAIPFLR